MYNRMELLRVRLVRLGGEGGEGRRLFFTEAVGFSDCTQSRKLPCQIFHERSEDKETIDVLISEGRQDPLYSTTIPGLLPQVIGMSQGRPVQLFC